MSRFSMGVSTIDTSTGIIYFTGAQDGDTAMRLFGVNRTTGALVTEQTITSANGYDPDPILLTYKAGSGGAGTVPNGDSIPGVKTWQTRKRPPSR